MIGGTDAHCSKVIGDVYTESEAKTLEELKQTIKDKKQRQEEKIKYHLRSLPFFGKNQKIIIGKRN